MTARNGFNVRELIFSLLQPKTTFYHLHPLPSPTALRLLEVHPPSVNSNSPVRCSVQTYDIKDVPKFDALSYTWGSPLPPFSVNKTSESFKKLSFLQRVATKHPNLVQIDGEHVFGGGVPTEFTRCFPIICNGETIHVTANLNDTLRMLSSGRLPRQRYIWIDALCIDQDNISERNEQVKLMSKIFKAAESVIVWLGEEDEFCEDAFIVIERLAEIPEEYWHNFSYTGFYNPKEYFGNLGIQPLTFHNWLGFLGFILRPWFKRTWVVQELALARSAVAVCGSRVVPWSKLSKALSFIKTTRWYHQLSTEKMRHIKDIRHDQGIYGNFLRTRTKFDVTPLYLDRTRLALQREDSRFSTTLPILIDSHRDSQATDPRDKIYAFLGIANKLRLPFNGEHNYIVPDYERPVQQVFADAARSLVLSSGNLDLLSHVQDTTFTRTPKLPSWVPDYTVSLQPYPLRFRGRCQWSAAGPLNWKPNIGLLEENLLEVQGFYIDTLLETSLLPTEATTQADEDDSSLSKDLIPKTSVTVAWASIVSLSLSLPPRYAISKKSGRCITRVEALWRTLIANTYSREHPAPPMVGRLFIDYVLNLQIRQRLAPWPNHLAFQAHQDLTSEFKDPGWRQLFASESEYSPYGLQYYRQRFTEIMEKIFDGTYSPIGLAQLQHEIEASSGSVRRIFRTKTCLLGIGPKSIRIGDEVWILAGANVPFVLRRLDGDQNRYTLVGEAYVHGIMHGDPQKYGKSMTSIIIH